MSSSSEPARGGLLGLGVFRPVGMAMVVLAVTVFGVVSLGKLPVDLLPPISYPSLTVRTVYPGAAPQDLEERVTERLEDALATVGGLVRMTSSSRAEVSEILLEFSWGSNLPFLVQDVRERLDRVFLPQGVDRPLILRYDPSLDPILRVALSGGNDLVRLRDVAERELERELEGLPGIAAVKVRGGLEDEVQVQLDPQRMAAFNVPPELVRQRLIEENLNVPGGTLEEGSVEYVVRTLNEFKSLQEIEALPVIVRGERFIKLEDIATVKRTHKDRDVVLRVAGKEAVEIDVYREAGANIVEASKAVKERLFGNEEQQAYWRAVAAAAASQRQAAEIKAESTAAEAEANAETTNGKVKQDQGSGRDRDKERREALKRQRMGDFVERKLPSDMKLTLLSDQAEFVRGAIDEVRSAGMIGGLLAIVICFLFLRRLSSTFIVGLSIPISIVATFGPMYVFGVSLNVMSLGGLALGIGMLVDNTIVVLESITRCREEGDPPLYAALRGVKEVGSAVTASTLTTIAVFAPIVFVEGIAGQTFGDQALTVVASLSISLAVALFLIPGLAARLERKVSKKPKSAEPAQEKRSDLTAMIPVDTGRFFEHYNPFSRRFWSGMRFPRRWWSILLTLVFIVATAGVGMMLRQFLLEHPDVFGGGGDRNARTPDEGPDPALVGQATLLIVANVVLSLCGWWWLIEYFFRQVGRFLVLVLGLAFFLVFGVAALALLVITLPFWLLSLPVAAVIASLQRIYPVFLRGAMRASAVVLILIAVLVFLSYRTSQSLGRELLPEVMQGELTAELIFPAGYPLEVTDRIATELGARMAALEGVTQAAVVSGADRESVSTEEEGPHTARITLRTERGPAGRLTEAKVEQIVREMLSREPSLGRFNLRRPTLLALNAPLEIEVLGDSLEELGRYSRVLEQQARNLEGILDLRSSIRRGNPEVRIHLNRERLAEHNLQLGAIADRLRLAVEGELASTFPGPDDRIDIRVRADLSMMQHIEQLRDLPVNPDADRPLPLGAIADFTIEDGPSEIRHINGRRAAVLTAAISGFDLGGTTDRLEQRLAEIPRTPEIMVEVGGQKREMEQSLESLFFALGLAVFLVYAVMAAQFESLLQPFLILFSVPLAGIGAILALNLTGTPVSVVALLGAVVLAGIVVNNAIVLVDRINRNRRDGMELEDAIVEAGRARLRPILMTTVTTVLGMLPLTGWLVDLPGIGSIGAAEGTELRAPMALVVISGLTFSTLLTLVVIPVGYRLLASLSPMRRETSRS